METLNKVTEIQSGDIFKAAEEIDSSFDSVRTVYDDIFTSWSGQAADAAKGSFDNFAASDMKDYITALKVIVERLDK